MFTACAFWMMKISTTVRARTPTISAVRMPLIRVDSRSRLGAGAGGLAGAEPLAEGGGRVPVPCGAADSVMALLPSGSGDRAGEVHRLVPWWPRVADRGLRLILGACLQPT